MDSKILTHDYIQSSIMVSTAISGFLAYACLIIYRLWFHPLARFPGPRLAAVTSWYEAYYELVYHEGAQYASKIRDLHTEYGSIVRINPNEISINDAQFHSQLYAPQPAVRDRHPNFSAALGTTRGSFSTVDHYLHRARRTGYSKFFASANVAASEHLVKERVNRLCQLLRENSEDIQHLRAFFSAITFDTFYTWAFGDSLGLLDDLPFAQQCSETVESLVTARPFYRIFPFILRFARRVPHKVLRRLSQHVARVFYLDGMIKESAERFVANNNHMCKEQISKKPSGSMNYGFETLFSALLRSNLPEREKTAYRMSQEGIEMFMAAFTPGRTMMLGMYYLHSEPDVLKRLRKELDMANPNPGTDLDFKTLNKLPYLRAVMKEILRITFPVGTRLPMICHEDVKYLDWIIPAHTAISVNHRSLLFDPVVFHEPHDFKPERWLESRNPIDEKKYFVAFGKGGRSCPGKEFATQLIQTTLASLIQRFEFEVVDTSWERDVRVARESILTAPAFESKGVKFSLSGYREHDV